MTLAEQLRALCEEHNLSALSVEFHLARDGFSFFASYAHADGVCGSSAVCREAPHDANGEAIASLYAKRGQSLVAVPELEAAA